VFIVLTVLSLNIIYYYCVVATGPPHMQSRGTFRRHVTFVMAVIRSERSVKGDHYEEFKHIIVFSPQVRHTLIHQGQWS